MPCRANQDRRVMVASSDKTWSTGGGDGIPLQYSCLENPMNSMKRQKNMTVKDKVPRLVGAQYATGERTDSLEETLMLGKIEGRRMGTTEVEMVGWHH